MSGIRRPSPTPVVPELAADSSGPMNLTVTPSGNVVLPSRQNSIGRTNMNGIFFGGIIDIFTWDLLAANVDPISFRATMTAVISCVMTGTVAGTVNLRTVVTDLDSGINIMDDTGPGANVTVGNKTPFVNCMGRSGILAAEFLNLNPLDTNWQILCLPVAGTGNATIDINASAVLTLAA